MSFPEDRVKFVCDWLVENKPEQGCDFYKMWISIEILRELVGNEWTNQAVFPNDHPVSSKAVKEAIAFLRSDANGYQFQERVSRLANRLYDVQDVAGLQKVIDAMKAGDIALGYAEIEASSFFVRRDIAHEFVTPTGKKGEDFDIKLIEHGVNCEVKHKIEDTAPSKEALEATLSSAKKQVPADEPALFFIKIPITWVQDASMKEIVERAKGTFFPRSPNVLGFILHWEEPSSEKEGAFFWKFRYEVNMESTMKNDDLAKTILGKEVEMNDTIVRMMNKYIEKCSSYPLGG